MDYQTIISIKIQLMLQLVINFTILTAEKTSIFIFDKRTFWCKICKTVSTPLASVGMESRMYSSICIFRRRGDSCKAFQHLQSAYQSLDLWLPINFISSNQQEDGKVKINWFSLCVIFLKKNSRAEMLSAHIHTVGAADETIQDRPDRFQMAIIRFAVLFSKIT